MRQKFFENTVMHPPLLCMKFFDTGIFWKHRRLPLRIFRHCETKNIEQRIVRSPSYAKIFSIPEIFWNIEWFPHKIWHCETKNFRWKIVIPPHPLSLIQNFFFIPENFSKHWSFSVLWDKKNRQNYVAPFLLCARIFDTRSFLKHRRVPLQNFSAMWDKKNQRWKFNANTFEPRPIPLLWSNLGTCDSCQRIGKKIRTVS